MADTGDVEVVQDKGPAPLVNRPKHYNWIAANGRLYRKLTVKQRAFLEKFSQTASVKVSCEAAGVTTTAHHYWMHTNANFRDAFDAARVMGIRALEDEVVRRGKEGVEEPVFYRDKVVGYKTKYSDTLLMFYLNGNAPEKYKNRASLEHSGPGGGPMLTVSLLDDLIKD